MLDRRAFVVSAGAAALLPGGRAAAAPATPDAAFAQLLDAFVDRALADSPELVTSLGLDRGPRQAAKGELHHGSVAALADRRAAVAAQLAQLRAIDRAALAEGSRVTYDTLRWDREATNAASRRFAYGDLGAGNPYVVSQIDGAWASVPDFLDSQHVIATRDDAEAYLSRLAAFARLLDEESERVRRDAGLGVIPPDFALDGAVAQMTVLRAPADRSPLVASLVRRTRDQGISGDWQGRAAAIYAQQVVSAIDRQVALLQSLRPRAVHDAGVWRLPDGDAYYAAALRAQTTTDLLAAEVHRLGLEVTRELSARAEVLFAAIGLTKGSIAERYGALYRDPRYLYPDTDAGKAREIADLNGLVRAMQARLPAWFGTLPRTPLEIRRIPAATEAGASTHYTDGSLDGTRPGIYWLNLRDTAEVPRWTAETTTYHEGIPGHHLQLTLQRQSDLPLIRKVMGFNAYAEGWALYAEQLAQEMGVYRDDPAGELGYLHDALLRSGRLVVDTGIHAMRWSREKAVETLSGIDGDPPALSGQEVERYACWPGQACGYMVGKVSLLRLRAKARAALGARFDIRRFHDAVLLGGSVPLAVLDTVIDRYIAAA